MGTSEMLSTDLPPDNAIGWRSTTRCTMEPRPTARPLTLTENSYSTKGSPAAECWSPRATLAGERGVRRRQGPGLRRSSTATNRAWETGLVVLKLSGVLPQIRLPMVRLGSTRTTLSGPRADRPRPMLSSARKGVQRE